MLKTMSDAELSAYRERARAALVNDPRPWSKDRNLQALNCTEREIRRRRLARDAAAGGVVE